MCCDNSKPCDGCDGSCDCGDSLALESCVLCDNDAVLNEYGCCTDCAYHDGCDGSCDCGTLVDTAVCWVCKNKTVVNDFGYCAACVRQADDYKCDGCDKLTADADCRLGPDSLTYCASCWNERFVACELCDDDWARSDYTDHSGHSCCPRCAAAYENAGSRVGEIYLDFGDGTVSGSIADCNKNEVADALVRIATILRLEPDPIGYIDFDEGKISMGSVDRRDAILCSDCGTYNRTRYCSNCGRPTR